MDENVLLTSPFVWLIVVITIVSIVATVRKVRERFLSKESQENVVGDSLNILLYLSGGAILLGLFGYAATLYSSACSGAPTARLETT